MKILSGIFDYYSSVPSTPQPYGFEFGYGTNNNGYPKDGESVNRLISVLPNSRQLDYLEMEYYSFIHFGINTMTRSEWGRGKEKPSKFNPKKLDTDQWCSALKASGSKGIVFTAKHHDGFCLWQSAYTQHSVKSSPYKKGRGDVVKELAESCKKYGLKLGLYLSPWDMHEPTYGTNAYNDYFAAQLTELAANYGEIFMFWFDGARGKNVQMDADFDYDFPRFYSIIKKYQPNAVTSIFGEDVRWVGNEAGVSRESEWSIVVDDVQQKFQEDAADGRRLKKIEIDSRDLGSREILEGYNKLIFKPAEVDVSIRKGWFFHKNQKPKSLEHLLKIYFKAVGGNSSLLLNVPPNKNGLIADSDVAVLKRMGEALADYARGQFFAKSILVGDYVAMATDTALNLLATEDRESSFELKDGKYIIDFVFEGTRNVSRIDIREDLRFSQRIELFEVWAKKGEGWQRISLSTVVGNRKIILFKDAIAADTIRLIIKQSRSNPHIRSVSFYEFD